ncbi:MAG: 2-iminoacetate synthase ThiH [Oscillospiraceae bacterium]|nr:2-iminoacetate synthase ThiH [Oscillospiraceae bacterium]
MVAELLQELLSPEAGKDLERLARLARDETRRWFGNSVSLYTPLYLANYCDNHCTYCGFSCNNDILRGKLSVAEIEAEFKAIAATGLEEILLLTGESREKSPPEYICEAVKLARSYFRTIGLEVYPLEVSEYADLHKAGADFVSVYQETYNRELYAKCHPDNTPKSDFDYRLGSQERALQAGMRGVSFGVLLGLNPDWRKDSLEAGLHAARIQRKFPHCEISFSVPRLRGSVATELTERELLQIMAAYRIAFPYAGINISTRERAHFRDNVIGIAANKISAGVRVTVGGHSGGQSKGDGQFALSDERSVEQIKSAILSKGLQCVYTDYVLCS